MGNFTSVTTKGKILIATNKLTLGLLLTFVIIEGYPKRVYTHFFVKQKVHTFSYSLNPQFIEQTDYCSIFNKQTNFVMFGNSLIYRMTWDELIERSDIDNRGVGSDITCGFIDRLKFAIPLKPKIVFIEGGINDLTRNIDTAKILENIKTIIASLKK